MPDSELKRRPRRLLAISAPPGSTPHRRHETDGLSTGAIRSGVFSSVAIPIAGLAKRKWTPLLAEIAGLDLGSCAEAARCTVPQRELAAAIEAVRMQGFSGKLATINGAVNRLIAYSRDRDVYGNLDYWARPSETLARARGDCEDIAILKMAALRQAGIPVRSLSLVILRDSRRNVFHAVVSVATSQGRFILDNIRDAVFADTSYPSYQALYSLSGERAWIHGYRKDSMMAAAETGFLDGVVPGEGPQPAEALLASISLPALDPLSVW